MRRSRQLRAAQANTVEKSGTLFSRRQFTIAGLGSLITASVSRLAHATPATELPRVLLLGDSISIGYTDFVIGLLNGTAVIARPANKQGGYENCEGTTKARANLEKWLGDTRWDLIHFNFGLHDLKHVDPTSGKNSRKLTDPQQASVEKYEENLEWIVEKLGASGAPLIFATTTPYHANSGGPLRDPEECEKYNSVAVAIMRRNGIIINDLYGLMLPRINEFLPQPDVHPTKAGYLALARQVADHIERALA